MKQELKPLSIKVLIGLGLISFLFVLLGGCPALRKIEIQVDRTRDVSGTFDSVVVETTWNAILQQNEITYDTFWDEKDMNKPRWVPFTIFNDQLTRACVSVPWIDTIRVKDNGVEDTVFYIHQVKKISGNTIVIDREVMEWWTFNLSTGYDPNGLKDTMWKYNENTDDLGNSLTPQNYHGWAGYIYYTHYICQNPLGTDVVPGMTIWKRSVIGEPVSAISKGAMEDSGWDKWLEHTVIAHELGHQFNFDHCNSPTCVMCSTMSSSKTEFDDNCVDPYWNDSHFELLTDSTNCRP